MILVGTSGWQYADWRGDLYPRDVPQRSWLRFYAARFPTVEVNNTFYRLPEERTFARWREQTPPGFVMTVKASRYVTHVRRLRDVAEPIRTMLERAAGLGDRLGPVLFQLPPTLGADAGLLRDALAAVPKDVRAAFEFRHRSWFDDRTYATLADAGAAIVLADRPGTRATEIVTAGWTYVRFHQGTATGPDYRRSKLRRWAERIAGLEVRDAYVYFNNDTGGAAVRDARALTSMLLGSARAG